MTTPARPHHQPTPLKTFLYGSAYYPEHWEEEIRAKDPELLRAAGWNVIRMAEFAWDRLEPREGIFDFELFDETIARMAAVGIKSILCTPTATPPRWLTYEHPEVLRQDERGVPMSHGSRQHASHLSPVFRTFSRRITQAMAEHFSGNPHVIGWQTDNEMHCHFSEDHSPAAAEFFIDFLRRRYHDDIEALNRAWGTAFWSQTYGDFAQIPTPRPDQPTHLNPAHVLDYRRSLAHGAAYFQRDQVEILRAANPHWWVTHNGCFRLIDFAGEFGRDLDFLSYDSYPFFEHDPILRPPNQAFNFDYCRAFSGNLVVMEQQSGPGGQGGYFHDQPEPGEMRRLAYVNIARGADGILFFRERSCRFGAEEYWCGILDHDNIPRRRYREASQLGAELTRVGPALLGTSVEIRIGVAGADFASLWGHEPLTLGLPSPRNMAEEVHGHFYARGASVGCVHPGDSLLGLDAYIVPHFAVFDPAWIAGWEGWVQTGGILIVGARTGSKDLHNNVVGETLPGPLRTLVGATVEEFGKQNRPDCRPLALNFPELGQAATQWWYEILRPDPATEVLATWAGRHLTGEAAITLRRVGKGAVIYVGTYLTKSILPLLEQALVRSAGLPPIPESLPGVETVVRSKKDTRLRFLINHNDHPVTIPLTEPGHDLITDSPVQESVDLKAGEVAVVRELLVS